MSWLPRFLLPSLGFAAATLGAPAVGFAQPEASAGPSEEARAWNEEALRLSKQGQYAEALVLFQRAYDDSPSYVILYNIGRMSRLTQDYVRSLDAFERFVDEGGDSVKTETQEEVDKEIKALRALIASLSGTVSPEGARVEIDGSVVEPDALASGMRVNPGKHRVQVQADGYVPYDETLDIASGEQRELSIALDEAEGEVAPPPPPEDGGLPGASWPSEILWAAWIATGAFAVGAGVTGTVAIVSANDLEDMTYAGPNRVPDPDSDVASTRDRVKVMAGVTNWLIVGAAVCGSAAIYLSIAKATEPDKTDAGATSGATLDAFVGLEGVGLRGTF